MRIFALGYSGTGSSAIVHLLAEYENYVDTFSTAYEHVPFYVPHGLFDLENTILSNNALYRSDAAINDFREAMEKLNNCDFGWFGGYKKRFGNRFREITDSFVSSLVEFSRNGGWSNDYAFERPFKAVLVDIMRWMRHPSFRAKRKMGVRLQTTGKDDVVNFCFDAPAEFHAKAKVFVDAYFEMIGHKPDSIMVTDQIIQPHHLLRFLNYSDPTDKFIVFERDARDLYLSSKYVWSKRSGYPIFPTEPAAFSTFYRRFRAAEPHTDDPRVLRMFFEDLIYRYEETVHKIEIFIGINKLGAHNRKCHFFKPGESMLNTQLFRISPEWGEEVGAIEELVPEFLYSFPYAIQTSVEKITDPNPNTSKIK